jgi:hypothetical protein
MEFDLNIYTISKKDKELRITENPKLKSNRRIIIGLGFTIVFAILLFSLHNSEEFRIFLIVLMALFALGTLMSVLSLFRKRETVFDKVNRVIIYTKLGKEKRISFSDVEEMRSFSHLIQSNSTTAAPIEFNGIQVWLKSGEEILLLHFEVREDNKLNVYKESNELLDVIKEYLPVPMKYADATTWA